MKMASELLSIALTLLLTFTIISAQICRIDLGIILDNSGSIKHWGFEQEKNFVRSVARQLRISSSNTRVSVMMFSTSPTMKVHFRDRAGQDFNSLNWALTWMRHSGGWTYTDRALNMARTTMFHQHYGSRKGAPKMLLLLTDGQSQSGTHKLSRAATLLKNNFVNIISIGVGRQIRRSELELIASRPINQHVFQVKDAWALNKIVNTVKTEACKPITCWYIHCVYNEWSAWSGTCHRVRRKRTVRQEVRKSKMVVGGCAGLNVLNCKPEVESKNLGVCLQTCRYVKCQWAPWGAWSASCGRAFRQRKINAVPAATQRVSCFGLPQKCYQRPGKQHRVTKCTCNYVLCKYGKWSQWSTTCGRGERRRNMQTIKKTIQKVNCNGLPQTCPNTPNVQTRTQKCSCNYVECKYGSWSAWTTSCGKGQRSRQMQTIKKLVQRENCNGLPTSCPTNPDIETRTKLCICNYVDCQYGPWSDWTTACGKGSRSRKMQAIPKTKKAEKCDGLTQSCPSALDVEKRTKLCLCNYVQCKYGDWSAWTTTCGKGKRERTFKPIPKSKEAENCDNLPKTCSITPDVESRTTMCTCNYVDCQYGPWSDWTTACGKGSRSRKMQTIQKTKQAEKCDGLTQSCPSAPDVENRNKLCKCEYVECKYTEWTTWNPACGKNIERKRTLQTIKKVAEKESCDGMTQICSGDAEQIEKKNELCECDAVKCELQWSAWSASCGVVKRVMRFVKVPIKVKQESCDGLTTTCSDATETQIDDIPCPKTSPPNPTPGPSASDAGCNADYTVIACLKDSKEVRHEFNKALFVDPYESSSTYSFSDYMAEIICRCAIMARAEKLQYFAISSRGQCLAGKDGEDNWLKHSAMESNFCLSSRRDNCLNDDTLCIGKEGTLFAYEAGSPGIQ